MSYWPEILVAMLLVLGCVSSTFNVATDRRITSVRATAYIFCWWAWFAFFAFTLHVGGFW